MNADKHLLKRLAVDLALLCADPENLESTFDLLNTSYKTEVAQSARKRLKADPAVAPLIEERYWGHWPSLTEFCDMPKGSLGHVYGQFMTSQGLSQLPDPALDSSVGFEDAYLQRRIRHTHDVWHVIAGLPITMAGEAAANGLTTEQLRWPGSALLVSADLIHRVSIPEACTLVESDHQVDLGVAIAYGLKLGATAPALLAQRWEEGWNRSLYSWREELGISDLVAQSPFPALPGDIPHRSPPSIVGSWTLRRLSMRRAGSTEDVLVWGEEPLGQLTYTADGRMSAVLCKASQLTSRSSAGACTEAEQADLYRNSYSYAGRYSVTPGGIVHHVEVAADPSWIGTDQLRLAKVTDRELTITTAPIASVVDPSLVAFEAIWERLDQSIL
jgi:ubiquinone biosynthesis protein COQ4